jgi:chorismate-pyruvate lyase
MTASAPTTPTPAPGPPAWVVLLERFGNRTGLPWRRWERLKGDQVPQPYKGLLVHSSDMTPTLENFYRQRLGITVLAREIQGDTYLREVMLHGVQDARPQAYGVICIHLNRFPETARRLVLGEQRPLGNILQSEGIGHLGWPQAFFRVASDPHLEGVLRLPGPAYLYGRRNVLLDGTRRLLADVIEVLAPAERPGAANPDLCAQTQHA